MDQIRGLLTCKPENTPHAGEVRKYTVTYPPAKNTGVPWTKISRDDDGIAYTVISVTKTAFASDRGLVSFNLVIEPTQDAPPASQEAPAGHFNQLPRQYTTEPPKRVEILSEDDYWTIKDQRDREREARQVAQQPRIERQHSQQMAIMVARVLPQLVQDTDGNYNFGKLHSLINQFQRDIGYIPPEPKGSQ